MPSISHPPVLPLTAISSLPLRIFLYTDLRLSSTIWLECRPMSNTNNAAAAATGYFDLQVNGYDGVDFNTDDLTLENLHKACAKFVADGAQHMLATIITERIPQMVHRLQALVKFREQDPLIKQVIAGIHIEGPFFNEQAGYRGAHPVDCIHPTNLDELKQLLDAAGGLTRIVTLAPERDPNMQAISYLAKQGVVPSMGHCNPTLDEIDAAIDAGAKMWTHLGNGCPRQLDRHENVIQMALSRADKLWLCFIADGVHVPFVALGNYLKLAGDRAIIVSDAMPAAGMGPGTYKFGRWEISVGEDLSVWAPDRSHLVGSALAMKPAAERLRSALPHMAGNIDQWMITHPRKLLGLA